MVGILILTGTAFILSIVIVIVSSLVNKDSEQLQKIEQMLPGLNCGACGYGSCKGMASEILKNIEAYKKCRPLRGEKKEKLEKYLQIEK